jgi:DNA-binding NarL/FixJ family response regulator
MLRLGVKGYLSKDIEVEDMHTALEQINKNGYYYPDALTPILVHALNNDGTFKEEEHKQTPEENPVLTNLTKNELEFLKLNASDQTYQQIADVMGLSPKTIDGYRDALFKKLKTGNRVGLALFAVKHGLVKL